MKTPKAEIDYIAHMSEDAKRLVPVALGGGRPDAAIWSDERLRKVRADTLEQIAYHKGVIASAKVGIFERAEEAASRGFIERTLSYDLTEPVRNAALAALGYVFRQPIDPDAINDIRTSMRTLKTTARSGVEAGVNAISHASAALAKLNIVLSLLTPPIPVEKS